MGPIFYSNFTAAVSVSPSATSQGGQNMFCAEKREMPAAWGRKGERKLFAKLLKINLRGQTWNRVQKRKEKKMP